ncbi:MAG: aminotransferase class I/II-fold pyridoxal phosphate-dependent enzyme [Planctomycetota bacterium]
MSILEISPSHVLDNVRYEIRGPLAARAHQLEHEGYDIVKLNIGNPGAFGFRMPETMRRAMIENLPGADAYCHQKGIFPAREAVVMQQQDRGVLDADAEHVFMGNGVSEMILMTMRALINPGDEVLVPAPDYPLWTASVVLHGGKAVHYACDPQRAWQPSPADIEARITNRTRAIVIINPNNPTGAVYDRETLTAIAELAERYKLVILTDEIYDGLTYEDAAYIPMASLVRGTLCATYSGLSKVYRACGMRVGWVSFSGERDHARKYIEALDLLVSLRLCPNVPGQWAVQTALGGYQSIRDLCEPGGRLHETRQAVLDCVARSPYLELINPRGALYAFLRVDPQRLPGFDDEDFAMQLLERKHVLVCPGRSFNLDVPDYFRITLLPEAKQMREVFTRIDELLADMAAAAGG